MAINIIRNPIRTPEEMAKFLGVSPERLSRVRSIMSEAEPVAKRRAVPAKHAAQKRHARKIAAKA